MPRIIDLLSAFLICSSTGASQQKQVIFSDVENLNSCPVHLPLTCSNSTPIDNECCFESPGGILLQTQFWDYYPAIGPSDEFTLHGLWPDNCDGTYEQFCNSKLNIAKGDVHNIVVEQFGDKELFAKIQKFWKNFNGDDESLWVHEFNKHATCIKTLRPQCYGSDFTNNQNVYDFLKITMNLYEKYPTYKFLAERGIVPSETRTYTFDEVSEALNSNFGNNAVYFKCNSEKALQEVWYYHYLQGPLVNENFMPIPTLMDSRCPRTGIKFLPKGIAKPPSRQPKGSKGYLKLSGHGGCLISSGKWYTRGTCATFRVQASALGGINLISSKGVCGVDDSGILNCNRQNTVTRFQFQVNEDTGIVSYGGKSKWCLYEAGRSGFGSYIQTPVKLADSECESFEIIFS